MKALSNYSNHIFKAAGSCKRDLPERNTRFCLQLCPSVSALMSEAATSPESSSQSRGLRVLPNGDVYEGEFEGNLPHGHGLLTYYNGSIYSGAFQRGKKHGFGSYRWSDGNVYKGNWENGAMHGTGVMTYSEGGSYSGSFFAGKKHGDGVFIDKRGNRFACPWDQGVMTGHGTIVFHTGTCYNGDIAAGQAHGSGSCEYSLNRKEDGSWVGCIYTGLWCRGVQTGHGIVKYALPVWPHTAMLF